MILILILTTVVSADNIFEPGETVLDERLNYDGSKEIFTELDGKYYRKLIKDDELLQVEQIELMPTGLKTTEEMKDKTIGDILPQKLKQMGISTYNMPSQLDYSNSSYLPPVGKQMENSCVGWAVGYYLRTYQQAMDIRWKIKDGDAIYHSRVFSPTFIYNQINGGKDDGAYMEDAGNLLVTMGASPLSYFPYIPGDYWTQPDSIAIQAAYPHRIRDWRILYTKYDSRDYIIHKTKEYLNTGDLLVAGIKVGFKFNYPMTDHLGNAIITTDYYANYGHAVVVVGYDDYIETPEGYGAFKIINSYGTDWGNDGFAYITYDAYVANIQSGYVFTDLINEGFLGEIENLKGEPISPTKYKITFDKVEGASGYRLLDENKRVILNFYTNQYVIKLSNPMKTTMYIQPFNQDGLGEMTAVEIDTTGVIQESLSTEVLEGVSFNIVFAGNGKYDVEVVDKNDNVVYEAKSNLGKPGLNTIYWNGLDLSKTPAADGVYTIRLLGKSFTFNKESKLDSAKSYLNKYNGEIKSLDIDISTKREGTLDLYIESKGEKKVVFKNMSLDANKGYNYNIDIFKYVKSEDLTDTNILIYIQ